MFPNKSHLFKSKQDAMNRSNKIHMCLACLHNEKRNWDKDPCPGCGKIKTRQMFSSRVEQKRGAELCLKQQTGHITDLQFQPKFPLIVNGDQITVYTADSAYYCNETKKTVIEDVKPGGFFIDKMAELKINLFNALYKTQGLSVTLFRKK